MPFSEMNGDCGASLPPERDDEPQYLRRDLVDEIRDHLESALLRERRHTADESEAKQRVLERFGNPSELVRQLWFQAMREKLMTQKMIAMMVVLMVGACLIAFGMMWHVIQVNQATTQTLVQTIQASNQSLLAHLQSLKSTAPSPAVVSQGDRGSLRLRLSLGKRGGPPANGFKVQLQCLSISGNDAPMYPALTYGDTFTDDRGLHFPIERSGEYQINIESPWGTFRFIRTPLMSNRNVDLEIPCPESPPKSVKLSVKMDCPDELKSEKVWLLCTFYGPSTEIAGESWAHFVKDWNFNDEDMTKLLTSVNAREKSNKFGGFWHVLVNSQGEMIDLGREDSFPFEATPQFVFGRVLARKWRIINSDAEVHRSSVTEVNWQGGELRLAQVIVVSEKHDRYGPIDEGERELKTIWARDVLSSPLLVRNLPEHDPLRFFVATADQPNELRIRLADTIVKNVKEYLEKAKGVHQEVKLVRDQLLQNRVQR